MRLVSHVIVVDSRCLVEIGGMRMISCLLQIKLKYNQCYHIGKDSLSLRYLLSSSYVFYTVQCSVIFYVFLSGFSGYFVLDFTEINQFLSI